VNLLTDVVGRLIGKEALPRSSAWVIADPYVVTNRELEDLIRQYLRRSVVTVPLPLPLMSAFFRNTIRSTNPKFDLVTQGEILGFMDLDVVYDPSETYNLLGIDPARYSRELTLEPVIREGLQS